VHIGAVRAALSQKLSDGAVIILDKLETADGKTKGTAEMFRRLGVSGKALVIDVKPEEKFTLSARNIAGLHLVAASHVTARDIMDTTHVIATREAIEKLQEALA
jgi:large subunit ribosomal protein L4